VIIPKFRICHDKPMFAVKTRIHGFSRTGNATRSVLSLDLLTLIVIWLILVFEIIRLT